MTGDAKRDPDDAAMTDRAATRTVALVMEVALDAPIETVWHALTDPALVARWLLPGGMDSSAGGVFRLEGGDALGPIDCTVLESDRPNRLVTLWRQGEQEGRPAIETTVRFDLQAEPGGGTRLTLVHDGFTVAAGRPVDAIATAEEEMIVLLPMAALMRRRPRRSRRPIVFSRGAMPLVMRRAA